MPIDDNTVKTFSSETEAHLARSLLATHGIQATVHRFSRYRAIAAGGWLLKVNFRDIQRAQLILKSTEKEVDMDEYVDPDDPAYRHCPACQSVRVTAEPLHGMRLLVAILFLGIPLLIIPRQWSCKKCGHTWEGR